MFLVGGKRIERDQLGIHVGAALHLRIQHPFGDQIRQRLRPEHLHADAAPIEQLLEVVAHELQGARALLPANRLE